MSDQNDKLDPGADDDALAGEYVLGVLDAPTRALVESRASQEPEFAARLTAWQAHFATLDAEYPEESLAPAVFAGLEERLFGDPPRTSFWFSLTAMRAFAVSAVTALVAFVSIWAMIPGEPGVQWIASLETEARDGRWIVLISPDATHVRFSALTTLTAEGKDAELWLIKEGEEPVSMGVLPRAGTNEIVLPASLRGEIALGDTLAVSLEPLGGSPTGKVTGPVVAAATLQLI